MDHTRNETGTVQYSNHQYLYSQCYSAPCPAFVDKSIRTPTRTVAVESSGRKQEVALLCCSQQYNRPAQLAGINVYDDVHKRKLNAQTQKNTTFYRHSSLLSRVGVAVCHSASVQKAGVSAAGATVYFRANSWSIYERGRIFYWSAAIVTTTVIVSYLRADSFTIPLSFVRCSALSVPGALYSLLTRRLIQASNILYCIHMFGSNITAAVSKTNHHRRLGYT